MNKKTSASHRKSRFSKQRTPDANPLNYGGQVLAALIGASYKFNSFSFGLEGGLPAYQNLNGLQMNNGWQDTSGFQAMF